MKTSASKAPQKYRYIDKEGLIAFASVASTLADKDISAIEDRFADIEGGKRDLALLRSVSMKLVYKLIEVMPLEDRKDGDDIKKWLTHMKIYTSVPGRAEHNAVNPIKDFGLYLSYEDINTLIAAAGEKCALCDLDERESKKCKLRKVLKKLPLADTKDNCNGCPYSSAFMFEIFGR